jgi:hypothetical protein
MYYMQLEDTDITGMHNIQYGRVIVLYILSTDNKQTICCFFSSKDDGENRRRIFNRAFKSRDFASLLW